MQNEDLVLTEETTNKAIGLEKEYQFILFDRVEKIKQINEQYDLLNNAYISFSGGKDSTVLSHLIDIALPNNQIPRLFINTGIEYKDIVLFVKELSKEDKRIKIISSGINIKNMLENEGYPFKSKQHSHNLAIYYNNKDKADYPKSIKSYLGLVGSNTLFKCPKMLEYNFTKEFKLHCSDKCCYRLKKEVAAKWQKENEKNIILTGMRKGEGGQRASIGCIVVEKDKLKKFHPLLVVSEEWEEMFIKENNIKLCKLYYPPYNFKRTGCKGCPFSLDLQHQLDIMKELLPSEYKQCISLWKPVYAEYRRIGYRLEKRNLFNFMEDN